MKPYRFVGAYSVIGDMEFRVFGSKASFSDEQFKEVSLGGAAFITEEDFEAIDIPEEMLNKYCSINYFGAIPLELTVKMEAARDKFRQSRAALGA